MEVDIENAKSDAEIFAFYKQTVAKLNNGWPVNNAPKSICGSGFKRSVLMGTRLFVRVKLVPVRVPRQD